MTMAVMISSMSLLQNGLDHCIAALNNEGVDGRTVYVIIISSQILAELPTKIKEVQTIMHQKCRPKYKRAAEILLMHDFFDGLMYFDGDKQELDFPAENMAKSFVLRALNGNNGYVKGGTPDLDGLQKQDIDSEEVLTGGKWPIEECEVSLKPEFRVPKFTTVQLLMYLHKSFIEAEYEANPSQFTIEESKSIFSPTGEINTAEDFRPGTSELIGFIPDELRFVEVMKRRLFSGRTESKPYKITDKALKKLFHVTRKKQQIDRNVVKDDQKDATTTKTSLDDQSEEGEEEGKSESTEANESKTTKTETPTKRKRIENGTKETDTPTESISPETKKLRKVMAAREGEKKFLESLRGDLLNLQKIGGEKNDNRSKKRAKKAGTSKTDEEERVYAKAVEDLLAKVAKRQEEVVDLTLDNGDDEGEDDNDGNGGVDDNDGNEEECNDDEKDSKKDKDNATNQRK